MGLMTGQHPSVPYPNSSSMPPDAFVSHPAPAYDPGRLFAYPRLSVADLYGGAAGGPYADPVAAAAAAGYAAGLTPAHHAAMLYPASLASPYELKDPRAAWAAGYTCDPTLSAYGPYADRFDPVDSEARRRNATRETTSTLKAWLNEHRKNPYPTKGEKIMLAIITKMTLTQVSTWFANARRRLKKENKMTWEPRNKTGDDLDDVSIEDDDEDDEKREDDDEKKERRCEEKDHASKDSSKKPRDISQSTNLEDPLIESASENQNSSIGKDRNSSNKNENSTSAGKVDNSIARKGDTPEEALSSTIKKTEDTPAPSEKPKIWSLARTATSRSPPPLRRSAFPTSSMDLEDRIRMNPAMFHERVLTGQVPNPSAFHVRGCEPCSDFRARNVTDSSADSSLSSPPLWKASEHINTDKYGRITPYDTSDLVSMSPSSSCSPVVVSSSFEASLPANLVYSPTRYLGCRLLPCTQDNAVVISNHSPIPLVSNERCNSHYSVSPSFGGTLDLRTIHSSFMRPSPFSCPVSYASATAQYHQQSISSLHKSRQAATEDGTSSSS